MPNYAITAIDDATCQHVRHQRTDPIYGYEYDVMASVAGPDGYGPCRRCLKKFAPGERRLLFLHNPFGNEMGDYAGPVFIHEQECTPFEGGVDIPSELADIPMFFRSYDRRGHFLDQFDVCGPDLPALLEAQFRKFDTFEVHIRNAVARCFIARAVRV